MPPIRQCVLLIDIVDLRWAYPVYNILTLNCLIFDVLMFAKLVDGCLSKIR
jgi:hypothetical protein